MIVIQVSKNEGIERALKRYKFKVSKVKQLDALREKQNFTKKSVLKRSKKLKAIYLQKQKSKEEL
jgi:small subunit ribosomal protein S21